MKIELIFYTQIASIVGFILALFGLYRLLVSQKDSVIELLRQRNDILEKGIQKLENESPDVLVESLANRVEIAKKEVARLTTDGEEYKGQIAEKETALESLHHKLTQLNQILEETKNNRGRTTFSNGSFHGKLPLEISTKKVSGLTRHYYCAILERALVLGKLTCILRL